MVFMVYFALSSKFAFILFVRLNAW